MSKLTKKKLALLGMSVVAVGAIPLVAKKIKNASVQVYDPQTKSVVPETMDVRYA